MLFIIDYGKLSIIYEAYELHFTEAIVKAKEFKASEIYLSETTEPYVRGQYLGEIARMHLKYKYDYRTYRWRSRDSGDDM